MTIGSNHQAVIVRTSRGLSLAGTRITLYAVMDYVKAGWPPKLIQDDLGLTNEQLEAALDYIAEHDTEFEAEYAEVVREAEENRRYWEEKTREREALIAQLPTRTNYPEARAKLASARAKRNHT